MRLKCKEKYDNVLDTWHVSFVYSFTNITDHMYKIEEYKPIICDDRILARHLLKKYINYVNG